MLGLGAGAHALTPSGSPANRRQPIERTRAAASVSGRDRANLWDLTVEESRPLPAPASRSRAEDAAIRRRAESRRTDARVWTHPSATARKTGPWA